MVRAVYYRMDLPFPASGNPSAECRRIRSSRGHRSGVHMPSLISLGTHSGCPLCYEMPHSSLKGEVPNEVKMPCAKRTSLNFLK